MVGSQNKFWQMVEERFNNGFPAMSVDGPLHADRVLFYHPLFNENVLINPAEHREFTADALRSYWKTLQGEYNTVMTLFCKSGNHESSFARTALLAWLKSEGETLPETPERTSPPSYEEQYGMEEGGFCRFTTSLPVIYLRLTLNEHPNLTDFVKREIPKEIQVDTAGGRSKRRSDASEKSKDSKTKLNPVDNLVGVLGNYFSKAAEGKPNDEKVGDLIAAYTATEKSKAESGKIDLLKTKIIGLKSRMNNCTDPEKKKNSRMLLNNLKNNWTTLSCNLFS